MPSIYVRHNIEIAHRLYEMPGKCEQIHGHSMWVQLTIHGHLDAKGTLDGLDFGSIKKKFRDHLDSTYDHKLLLNGKDVWAGALCARTVLRANSSSAEPISTLYDDPAMFETLPGLVRTAGDPTTENIAKWIAEWAVKTFNKKCDVDITETNTNGAGYSAHPRNGD